MRRNVFKKIPVTMGKIWKPIGRIKFIDTFIYTNKVQSMRELCLPMFPYLPELSKYSKTSDVLKNK